MFSFVNGNQYLCEDSVFVLLFPDTTLKVAYIMPPNIKV